MRVLLVSTYELGHQPLHLASPAGVLARSGHEVRVLDLAVESWSEEITKWPQAAAFSVPMHTAMRLATEAARHLRESRPGLPVCFYGLYAALGVDPEVRGAADQFIAGEYEPALLSWVDRLASASPVIAPPGLSSPAGELSRTPDADQRLGDRSSVYGPSVSPVTTELARRHFGPPSRSALPALDRYARLLVNGEERLAGYVEASHGCAHRCRHCPVPVVYDGRTRLVDLDVVCDDVESLVAMGAEHVSFGDPDFLNGPHHARRVVRAVHERFPELTFDFTAKVEHILRHRSMLGEMASSGCLFVVSAFESTNDGILSILDKGHTVDEEVEAVGALREHGIEPRPSFVPFTPWTAVEDMVDLVDFVERNDLVWSVDPVQYSIRLLIPPGSLLLEGSVLDGRLGPFDAERLGYSWQAEDPALDDLQVRLADIAGAAAAALEPASATFESVREAVLAAAGLRYEPRVHGGGLGRPRLSEPWFCCAEPMESQQASCSR